MTTVRIARLREIAHLTTGSTPDTSVADHFGGAIPFVTPSDLGTLESLTTAGRTLSPEGARQSRLVPEASVLVCCIGSLGKVGFAGTTVAINQQINAVTFDESIVFPRYGLHACALLQRKMEKLAPATTVPIISKSKFGELTIPVPPLGEQRRIADILDRADALRRKRAEAIKLCDDLLRATFFDMFGDPIANGKCLPTAPLGDLCTIRRGASPRPIDAFMGGTVPWVKIGDGTKPGSGFWINETASSVTELGASRSVRLKPGAVIFANCGVSLGFARILGIEGCIHDGWLALEGYEGSFEPEFLVFMINQSTNYFRSLAPEGTQPNLNTGIMKSHQVPIPDRSMQRNFCSVLKSTNRMLSRILSGSMGTTALHSSLSRSLLGVSDIICQQENKKSVSGA